MIMMCGGGGLGVVRGLHDGFPLGIPVDCPFPPERVWAKSLVPDDFRVIIEDYFDTVLRKGQIKFSGLLLPLMVVIGKGYARTPCR